MPRPTTPRLNREMIVDAGLALVGTRAGLTMPGLASKLGVSVSSVYHHVPGRSQLLELMRGKIASSRVVDIDWDAHWRVAVAHWVRQIRMAFSPYPELVTLLTAQTVTAPEVLDLYGRLASTLLRAGFPQGDVIYVISALDSFSLGSALDRAAPERVWATDRTDGAMAVAIAAAETGIVRSDLSFDYGLDALLDGLEARLLRTQNAPDPGGS